MNRPMAPRDEPGQGPLDRPERDLEDPIGDDAYPGGSGMLPPTGDMEDPIPETGMVGEPELEESQLDDEEELDGSPRPPP